MKFIFAIGVLFSITVHAQSDLPYSGSSPKDCEIKPLSGPEQRLDAGFVSNRDCSKIYILPPKTGVIELRPLAMSIFASTICENLDTTLSSLMVIRENPGTPEYTKAATAAIARAKNYIETIKAFSNSGDATAIGIVKHDWLGLVNAYRESNPQLTSKIYPLPIEVVRLSDQAEPEIYTARTSMGGIGTIPSTFELNFGVWGACVFAKSPILRRQNLTYRYWVQTDEPNDSSWVTGKPIEFSIQTPQSR